MVRWWVLALLLFAVVLTGARRKRVPTGTVIVNSTTTGAQIYVDGDHLGEVPMKLPLALRAGEHTIKVTLLGHADYLDTFSVKRGKDTVLEVDLLPISGVLQIGGEPPGALLIVDGRTVGELPYQGELEPGTREIEVRADGYIAQRKRMRIEAGQSYPISVSLDLLPPVEDDGPTPWYGHWWVWAGGAAVVAAGITVALLAGNDEPPPAPDFSLSIDPIR